ncbi:MAG: hypothetical protein J6I37_01205 [Prevotella sp.]|nr:hypothetical protein [Prevotella sp.]
MKNLPVVFFIPMLGIKIMILVLFDRSIRIPRAHARIHKVFYPCHRCRLAKLFDYQWVVGNNEAATVTTIGDFCPKSGVILSQKRDKNGGVTRCMMIFWEREGTPIKDRRHPDQRLQSRGYFIPPYGTSCSTPWNKVFHPMEQTGRCRLRRSKPWAFFEESKN